MGMEKNKSDSRILRRWNFQELVGICVGGKEKKVQEWCSGVSRVDGDFEETK